MRIKTGDKVIIIAGNDKGKSGAVLRAIPTEHRVVVEGVNIVKKHQRPKQTADGSKTQGGIVEREAAIDVSNVMLICPHTNEPTKVGVRRDAEGRRVRVSKRSGKDIE